MLDASRGMLARRMLGKDSPEKVLTSGRVKQIITPEILSKLRDSLEGILVKDELSAYIVDIVRRTRQHPSILVGAGPRATQALILASRTYAAINGRDFVTPEDVQEVVPDTLRHRILLDYEAEADNITTQQCIDQILASVPAP